MSDVSPEGQAAPVEGQSISDPTPETAPQGQVESFLSFSANGQDFDFKTRDEAQKHYVDGTLRHSDYTKKTQALAEERKAFQQREKDLESQMSTFMQTKAEYDKYSQFLQSRPDVLARIKSEMQSPRLNMDNVDARVSEQTKAIQEEMKALKEKMEAEEQARASEANRQSAYKNLGGKYEDFDQEAINQMIAEIEGFSSLPPEQAMQNFAEILYYAQKGRSTPEQIAERMQRAQAAKATKTVPMGPNTKQGLTAGASQATDFDEIAAIAKKEMGVK
jgi:hypothetical protein